MPIHVKRVENLLDGDRILLKDLRILTVQGRPRQSDLGLEIRYHDLARKEYDAMVLDRGRQVKTICHNDGKCPICTILEDLI